MRPQEALHRPDIKDIGPAISEAERFTFDPRRDIHSDDREEIRKIFLESKQPDLWLTAAHFAIFLPDIDPGFDPQSALTSANRRSLRHEIESLRLKREWFGYAICARLLAQADSTFHFAEAFRTKERQELLRISKAEWELNPCQSVVAMRLIHEVDPTVDFAQMFPNELCKHIRSEIEESKKEDRLVRFAELVAFLHEVDPSFQINAELSSNVLRTIQEYLQVLADSGWWEDYAFLASFLNTQSNRMQKSSTDTDPPSLPPARKF